MFRRQTDPREFRMSGFRAQSYLDDSCHGTLAGAASDPESAELSKIRIQATPAVSSLKRSGKCYQLSWNLKTVVIKRSGEGWPGPEDFADWSIRQAAFYHQFDVANGRSLWLITSGREDVQKRVEDLTGPGTMPKTVGVDAPATSFRSSLKTMLDFGVWSGEGWRDYVSWAEESMEAEVGYAWLLFCRRC